MVAAATARVRTAYPNATPPPAATGRRRFQPNGTWVLIAIPVLLVSTFVWQIASSALHADIIVRRATAIGSVSLEADPAGSRIDFVVVDRFGQETTIDGTVNVKLREPDGTLWQTSRAIGAADFQPLPDGGLLAGRSGLSVVVPASDWARAPRRGGAATVTINVQPSGDGAPISTVEEQRFP
jgi:hypothetical protein